MHLHRLLTLLVVAASVLRAQTPQTQIQAGGVDLVLISPGKFTQGSLADEPGRESDEERREVTITQSFYMSATPVSRGTWQTFVQAANYRTEAEKGPSGGFGVMDGKLVQARQFTWRSPGFEQSDDHPVVMVTWDDAQAFCRWFSGVIKRRCSLPSEAQWEYATRAGTAGARYGEPLDEVAWHRGNSGNSTHSFGQKRSNPWGLKDLYGPVWQWCEDWYAPYQGKSVVDPVQRNSSLSDKPRRVLRGGSFLSDSSHSRSAERYRNDPKSRNADNGFRIVASVEMITESPRLAPAQTKRLMPAPSSNPPRTIVNQIEKNSGFSWSSLLPCFIPLVLLFFIVRAVARRVSARSQAVPHSFGPGDLFAARQQNSALSKNRLTTRVGNDGFWINGAPDNVGQRIAYSYIVNGVTHHDQVMFSPGPEGHFIFTGSRPQTVSIQTSGQVIGDTLISSQPADEDRHRWSSSSRSSSFPSAY